MVRKVGEITGGVWLTSKELVSGGIWLFSCLRPFLMSWRHCLICFWEALAQHGATPHSLNFVVAPLSIIPSILFATLIPFIEELGWRGYSLDRLQAKWSALVSTLILGSVWSLWHLPLFFVEGTYQANLGVGTLEFWVFMIGVVALSFPFTWIYNNTRRSTLAVILFHAMINFTGEVIAITERADVIATTLWIVAAAGIVVLWGSKTFTREKATQ
jgi:membrane protease YdiL (CAAX protease family)